MKKKHKSLIINNEHWGYVVHTHAVNIYSPAMVLTKVAHNKFDYSINEETEGLSIDCIRPAMVRDYIKRILIKAEPKV